MSLYGLNLPKQQRFYKAQGPVEKNAGGAAVYDSPMFKRSHSFQWNTYFKARPDLYKKIQNGETSVLTGQYENTSNCFEFTARNTQHQFHSHGIRQHSFNNQRYNQLMKDTRFRDTSEVGQMLQEASPMQKTGYHKNDAEIEYDIKGNTYKNTLIPEKSAKSAFGRHRGKSVNIYSQRLNDINNPVKPRYKGYIRSGQILFNNINQINTQGQVTPKAQTPLREPLQSQGQARSLKIDTKNTDPNYKSAQKLMTPVKQNDHMAQTMNQLISYSPEYNLNKLNNYDNTVKNVSREIYQKCDFSRFYPKKDSRNETMPKNAAQMNQGSFMGYGNRTVLYGSWMKDTPSKPQKGDEIDKTQLEHSNKILIKDIRNQKHYDSNIKNEIVYQQNLVEMKARELDMRSQGVQKYGYQPLYGKDLVNKRKIDGILFDQVKGREPDSRLPQYKRKFTPITTYQKSLYDSRITHLYSNKMKS